MPIPTFRRLNDGWNAEPNVPDPRVTVRGSEARLRFVLNAFLYAVEEDEDGCLIFRRCSRWRLGSTDDEGWYRGQCRYGRAAPAWGEFYEVSGDDDLRPDPADWNELGKPAADGRHFLFYLRDQTFECSAAGWRFDRGGASS